jgi:hypothetical protein
MSPGVICFTLIISVIKMWRYETYSDITKHCSELAVMEVVGSINAFTF